MPKHNRATIFLIVLICLDLLLYQEVWTIRQQQKPGLYFLDVGQGDAELLTFGGVKILIDAGPDKRIIDALEDTVGASNRYLDLAIISHPQLDHFNGLNYVLQRYEVGALIINGRDSDQGKGEWMALLKEARKNNIPILTLARGDAIHYAANHITILAPDKNTIASGELNDTGLVKLVTTPHWKALLVADIGTNIEQYFLKNIDRRFLRADVLKVGHHGSKFSSSQEFLDAVQPKVAVIEVGRGNRYGHPAAETLRRLAASTIQGTFRTDLNGLIHITEANGKLLVFVEQK